MYPTPQPRIARLGRDATRANGRPDLPLLILLVWIVFEFGRPPVTFGLPMMISLASAALWLMRPEKQLGPSKHWWFVLLVGMTLMVPVAVNNYGAYTGTRFFAILFLTVCLPLQSLLRRLPDVRAWVYTFLIVATYVGIWAAFHGGYGPAGRNGHDENYVAAIVTMSVPFAYFLMVIDERKIPRLLFTTSIVFSIAAIALADNASRGGFLALCCVAGYIIFRSPRRLLSVGVLSVAGIALLLIAGDAFWEEIGSSTDFDSGTGDLRIRAWKAGFRMFVSHPILGVGPGNFPWQLGQFETAREVSELGRSLGGSMVAHSMWVELIAELGLVGIIGTLALCWSAWKGLERVQRRADRIAKANPAMKDFFELRSYALAIQGAMVAIAVNGLFLSLLYYSHLWLLIVLGNAMPYVMADLERRHSQRLLVGAAARPSGSRRPARMNAAHRHVIGRSGRRP